LKHSHNHVGRRHLIIPDPQTRPGVPLDHLDWVAQAIVDYEPDVVAHIGDHWDMPSLNGHEKKGSFELEGARYADDIAVGNEALNRISAPGFKEAKRQSRNLKRKWDPRWDFFFGNHENRAERAANENPTLIGSIGVHDMLTPGWKRHDFLKRVWIDGIVYSHYFQGQNSSFPVGGTIDNRLNKIGDSFVQGHQQGFMYGNRVYPTGRMRHGLVAGSCYLHAEDYKGKQGNNHFRGIVVLNEVVDGDYCVMPLSLKYLCMRYEGIPLIQYMEKKYKKQNWEHLET
jgi:hypothetical protein